MTSIVSTDLHKAREIVRRRRGVADESVTALVEEGIKLGREMERALFHERLSAIMRGDE